MILAIYRLASSVNPMLQVRKQRPRKESDCPGHTAISPQGHSKLCWAWMLPETHADDSLGKGGPVPS